MMLFQDKFANIRNRVCASLDETEYADHIVGIFRSDAEDELHDALAHITPHYRTGNITILLCIDRPGTECHSELAKSLLCDDYRYVRYAVVKNIDDIIHAIKVAICCHERIFEVIPINIPRQHTRAELGAHAPVKMGAQTTFDFVFVRGDYVGGSAACTIIVEPRDPKVDRTVLTTDELKREIKTEYPSLSCGAFDLLFPHDTTLAVSVFTALRRLNSLYPQSREVKFVIEMPRAMAVAGASAGALIYLALECLIFGRPFELSAGGELFTVTGTIADIDGRIGMVDGIVNKAVGAEKRGYTKLFVPESATPDIDEFYKLYPSSSLVIIPVSHIDKIASLL
jgi:hypothetical protein